MHYSKWNKYDNIVYVFAATKELVEEEQQTVYSTIWDLGEYDVDIQLEISYIYVEDDSVKIIQSAEQVDGSETYEISKMFIYRNYIEVQVVNKSTQQRVCRVGRFI